MRQCPETTSYFRLALPASNLAFVFGVVCSMKTEQLIRESLPRRTAKQDLQHEGS